MILNNIKKISEDLEKLLFLLGSGVAFLIIASFGIYRFSTGEYSIAITDTVVASSLLLFFVQTWRDKNLEYLKVVTVTAYMIGIFALIYVKGTTLYYWLYPAIGGTFFLLENRRALPINILAILASMFILVPQIDFLTFSNVYATLILVCVFGYTFSAKSEYQNKQLSLLATQDDLTKVGNRRSLDERIRHEIEIYAESNQTSSILLLDLDHFKKINDTFGHIVGDEVLIDFAKMLNSSMRVTDCVYRYGGEEFVIIANDTELEDAGKFAEYLRDLIEENLKAENHKITVSIGVAEISSDDTEESWLHRADLALYEAKNKNRNTVFLAVKDNTKKVYSYHQYLQKEPATSVETNRILKTDVSTQHENQFLS